MANINRITTPDGVTYDLVKKELTLEQYNALSTAEKNNGTVYLITDTGEIISNSVVYSGGASSLDDLTDVTLTNPVANETLVCEIVNNDPVFKNKATTWTGTEAQYNAILVKDPNVTYYITDGDSDARYIICTQAQYNAWKTAGTLESDTPYYITDAENSGVVINDTTASRDTVYSSAEVEDLLSDKQDATDNNLDTTNKTIVGAINELKSGKADLSVLGGFKLQYRNIESNSTVFSPFFTEMCIAFCSRGANALGVASTASANALVSDSSVTFGLNTQDGYRMSVASNVGTHIKVCFIYY